MLNSNKIQKLKLLSYFPTVSERSSGSLTAYPVPQGIQKVLTLALAALCYPQLTNLY